MERAHGRSRLFAKGRRAAGFIEIAQLVEAVLHLLDVVALVALLHDVLLCLTADEKRVRLLAQNAVGNEVVVPLKAGQCVLRVVAEVIGRLIGIHVPKVHQRLLYVQDQLVGIAFFQHAAVKIIRRLDRLGGLRRRRFGRRRRHGLGRGRFGRRNLRRAHQNNRIVRHARLRRSGMSRR